ncbi:hypothetical protein AKJ65_03610 [candidate division MSBL1 archaeon SCGC-AAA259E19]|uniref:Uncharacterized protein n=1 Tax=candidate division MSBL1 archaeon SCGC-AAA259E19 TaxID=1698264 RepID=A0A133UKR1_9EURY|nr:hypothetical protein AKJ65_03610 [candidate division MSBL1 archaeon SCGC-AAA259E19]
MVPTEEVIELLHDRIATIHEREGTGEGLNYTKFIAKGLIKDYPREMQIADTGRREINADGGFQRRSKEYSEEAGKRAKARQHRFLRFSPPGLPMSRKGRGAGGFSTGLEYSLGGEKSIDSNSFKDSPKDLCITKITS